jgi:hypothetical protein
MKALSNLTPFFKSLIPLARVCLLMAMADVAVAVYSWLPLRSHSQVVLMPMALITMAILFAGFILVAYHHWVVWSVKDFPPVRVSLPRAYWLACVVSLLYFLAVFVGGAFYYPPGADLGPAVGLRIFSSGSLFLCLMSLGFVQWLGLRLRAYRAAA